MPANAELARGLEGEDDAAGRRTGDEVDQRARRPARHDGREEPAQLAGGGRVGEDRELLDVGVAVAAALEQEVALAERARAAEQRLGPGGDREARAASSAGGWWS